MKRKHFTLLTGSIALAVLAAAAFVASCSSPAPQTTATMADKAAAVISSGKGGAQLWSDNCARCHNIRSPNSYSDAQWDAAMMHMRVRADLTAEETRKILEFLKSAN